MSQHSHPSPPPLPPPPDPGLEQPEHEQQPAHEQQVQEQQPLQGPGPGPALVRLTSWKIVIRLLVLTFAYSLAVSPLALLTVFGSALSIYGLSGIKANATTLGKFYGLAMGCFTPCALFGLVAARAHSALWTGITQACLFVSMFWVTYQSIRLTNMTNRPEVWVPIMICALIGGGGMHFALHCAMSYEMQRVERRGDGANRNNVITRIREALSIGENQA